MLREIDPCVGGCRIIINCRYSTHTGKVCKPFRAYKDRRNKNEEEEKRRRWSPFSKIGLVLHSGAWCSMESRVPYLRMSYLAFNSFAVAHQTPNTVTLFEETLQGSLSTRDTIIRTEQRRGQKSAERRAKPGWCMSSVSANTPIFRDSDKVTNRRH
ncbi:hypothetical protein KQX54_014376 [Cotesia glomerata]|uniref:Uncharacterized protein n=1 Tax=Cotesia glomerata TaxID=32391 RepID=A0AAV7ILC1_COTGL|nr:hypothetical protein KQX54_014376 [Cotesia glomerata]